MLRYTLKLEAIGDNVRAQMKSLCAHLDSLVPGAGGGLPKGLSPWVAKLRPVSIFRFERDFVKGQKDYSESNSVGSRGIWIYYFLEPGFYEVYARESWNSSRRYFLQVEGDGTAREISKQEVMEWLLNQDLESMS